MRVAQGERTLEGVFTLYTPYSGFAPRKRSKNAREGAGWKVGTMWPARRIVAKLKSCAPEGKRKRGSAGLESSHGHAQCAWLVSARRTRVAVRGWCARSAHLVWRAGDGVRGDVACRRLARLGLEIPAVRGAVRGPWPRGVWGGEGGAAGASARAAPLTTRCWLLAAGYARLARVATPPPPPPPTTTTTHQGRHASFSASTPLVSSEEIHSSLPMYGTHASASPAARAPRVTPCVTPGASRLGGCAYNLAAWCACVGGGGRVEG